MNSDENLQKAIAAYEQGGPGTVKVLMVEDDEFVADMVMKKLSDKGCIPFRAENGEDGLRLVERFQPHVIILDLMLPKMSGEEVLQNLKNKDETKGIPVVVFSNKSEQPDIKGNLDGGAIEYLIKSSTDLNRLVEVVKKHGQEAGA